jgi:uncharacterized protein YxeA
MKKILTLMTGLLFLVAIAAFAQNTSSGSTKTTATHEHKAKNSVTHQATGTISSVDAGTLVLTHKVHGKEEQTTFSMNDQTRKQGELKSGDKATVHYKVEAGQNVATMVKGSGKTTASNTSSKSSSTSTASSSKPHKH